MAKEDWISVSAETPCPICKYTDNCKVSKNGTAVYCGRQVAGSESQNNGGQFLHRLGPNFGLQIAPLNSRHLRPRTITTIDASEIAHKAFEHPDAESKRKELATDWGVTEECLRKLFVGWSTQFRKPCWTIPERSPKGAIVGINRRFEDGTKMQWSGGSRGLIFVSGWLDEPGPVLLPEGASDVAVLLSMRLCAVGRPSCCSCIDELVELLGDLSPERPIVVLGECDRKTQSELSNSRRHRHRPDCPGCSLCWPGRHGAIQTANELMRRLGREIAWALPPDGAKDIREWIKSMRGRALNGRV